MKLDAFLLFFIVSRGLGSVTAVNGMYILKPQQHQGEDSGRQRPEATPERVYILYLKRLNKK